MSTRAPAAPDWPAAADRFSVSELSDLTGVRRSNLSSYRSGRIPLSIDVRRSVEVASLLPEGSHVVRRRVSTIPRLALALREVIGSDPRFGVRLVRQACEHGSGLSDENELAVFFGRPPRTGSTEWDALLAGVSEYALGDRAPRSIIPWTTAPRLYLPEPWSPIPVPEGLVREWILTPAELRARSVVLKAGNLSWL